MKSSSFAGYRFVSSVLPVICLLLTLLAGCSQVAKGPDEAAMKKSFARKGPLNINDVPPDKRAMVEALMKATKGGPPPAHVSPTK